VIIEAMAAGVVVIAENDYGVREMVEDGVTGFLCHTSEQMAEVATRLSGDEGLRLRVARNARARVETLMLSDDLCWRAWRNVLSEGPGTILKRNLGRLGIKSAASCKCNERARLMDLYGVDWCEGNMAKIVGWLREEAERRHLPFLPIAAKTLVKLAIHKSKKRI
jgi:hypothetical protein